MAGRPKRRRRRRNPREHANYPIGYVESVGKSGALYLKTDEGSWYKLESRYVGGRPVNARNHPKMVGQRVFADQYWSPEEGGNVFMQWPTIRTEQAYSRPTRRPRGR